MRQVSFKIDGQFRFAFGVVEDHTGQTQFIGFDQNTASVLVTGGGLAWFTFAATGDPGTSVTIKTTGQTGNQACPDHEYKFPLRGKFAWPFQFNPEA